jgi:nicotinate phosphoribosyltransferase
MGNEQDLGDVEVTVRGLWVDVVLYEIPLLALTSEAYFRFVDTDWTHDGQGEKAYAKGMRLLEAGCTVSEYGTRRRRDLHTHELVVRGLVRARAAAEQSGLSGRLSGTSNVHLARQFGLTPTGTVGNE